MRASRVREGTRRIRCPAGGTPQHAGSHGRSNTPVQRLNSSFVARAFGRRRSSRRSVAVLTTLALAAGLAGMTGANAKTTPTPSELENGSVVVRDDSIDLNVETGGLLYF